MTDNRLVDAVKAGHREGLEALRDRLAEQLDRADLPAHTVGPLARQLQAVLHELAELPTADQMSLADALRERREGFRRRVAESAS